MNEPQPQRTRRSERVLSDWIKRENRRERRKAILVWLPIAVFVAGVVVLALVFITPLFTL